MKADYSSKRNGSYVETVKLGLVQLENHDSTGFVCLDLLSHCLCKLLQVVRFAYLDLEVTDENDW